MPASKPVPSRSLLHEALLQLLKKKPLNKITVQELCKKAGVNRTTFYNHYETPDDILREIVGQFAASFSEQLRATPASYSDRIAFLLQQMESHRDLTLLLLDSLPGAYLSECILELPEIRAMLPSSAALPSSAIQDFILAGSSQLMIHWIRSELRISPQEEALLILELCGRLFNS